MSTQTVSFTNRSGDTLAGRLITPITGETKAYALFAHCFTCTKNLAATRNIARALAEAGIATLIFDFTGLGNSEGEFADTNFSSNVDDLVAAADFLAAHFDAPRLLAGHSLGGTAVLKAAARIDSALAVASIGSPSEPAHVAKLMTSKRDEIQQHGVANVTLGGRPFTIKRQFLDDIEHQSALDAVAHLRKALLVMHAPLDDTVEISNATDIFKAAKHPKSFVSLDNADHLLTRREDSEYVGKMIAAWATRFLSLEPEQSSYPQEGMHGAAARTRADGFKTHLNVGGHPMLADEPVTVGGTNTGPAPFDLLSSSLAACTTMTLKMYAERKQWPLESSTCHVTHRKEKSDSADAKPIDVFDRILTLDGDLSETQRARMLEIANRCPVHRTLHNTIDVRTTLTDA
ncbi:MAG: bifunctional alpha/beta hydrolase/OsmC family protein [Pseudomonadota bacterium]